MTSNMKARRHKPAIENIDLKQPKLLDGGALPVEAMSRIVNKRSRQEMLEINRELLTWAQA